MAEKSVAAIVCAAGASNRFGRKEKKVFANVEGRAMFLRSLERFSENTSVKQIILAVSPEDEDRVKLKWGANLSFFGVKVCLGGKARFETVANALKHVRADIDLVAVHDAARCCITDQWIADVIAKAGETGAAILACPVIATIKKAVDGVIAGTVDRGQLWEAQTPQVFERKLLVEAYANLANIDSSKISDDAGLVEAMGQKVYIVESDTSNWKVTYPADTAVAEAIIKSRPRPKPEGLIGPYIEAQW
ncbi:MAG TPA: 2-C-methyl-D-erythritol 4-phosphate cytidylyltransferase [Sedimentisphaerales bacterium]|nr:2-C-methyl-D-erythritol 4-phosphate cytidylyltransferase [Sedimentisphaerales bacterium]